MTNKTYKQDDTELDALNEGLLNVNIDSAQKIGVAYLGR